MNSNTIFIVPYSDAHLIPYQNTDMIFDRIKSPGTKQTYVDS